MIRDEDETVEETTGPGGAWMVTFTDLVSLMLTFFVMLYSMSTVEVDKWKDMINALSQTLNPDRTLSDSIPTAEFNISSVFRKRAMNLDYLEAVLQDQIARDAILAKARLVRLDDRLVVALPGDLMFQAGEAFLSEEARDALFELGGILRNISNQVGVNGHSDPKAVRGDEYSSNWELSLARAVSVANALKRSGYTKDIIAYGYADSLFGDLPALPEAERMALARRVDISIMPSIGLE